MTTQFQPDRFVNDFAKAMNGQDVDKLLEYYAENAELEDPTTAQPIRGRDAIHRNFSQWSRAFGESKVKVEKAIVNGNDVAILFDITGRHTGDLELSPGDVVPATNRSVTMRVGEFLRLDSSGKIVSDRAVFDLVSMMTQLGLMPSTQATTTSERQKVAGSR